MSRNFLLALSLLFLSEHSYAQSYLKSTNFDDALTNRSFVSPAQLYQIQDGDFHFDFLLGSETRKDQNIGTKPDAGGTGVIEESQFTKLQGTAALALKSTGIRFGSEFESSKGQRTTETIKTSYSSDLSSTRIRPMSSYQLGPVSIGVGYDVSQNRDTNPYDNTSRKLTSYKNLAGFVFFSRHFEVGINFGNQSKLNGSEEFEPEEFNAESLALDQDFSLAKLSSWHEESVPGYYGAHARLAVAPFLSFGTDFRFVLAEDFNSDLQNYRRMGLYSDFKYSSRFKIILGGRHQQKSYSEDTFANAARLGRTTIFSSLESRVSEHYRIGANFNVTSANQDIDLGEEQLTIKHDVIGIEVSSMIKI